MNLHQLVLEQHLKESNQLLESVCKDLTQEQSRIVKGVHKEFLPLIEASLTADQVNQIFTGVQQNSRTVLGKGVDTVKKVNDVINQVGGWLQNTAPVQFADQKFEKLKSTIGTKFPELDKQLTSFGTWMKENPGKSAAIIGVLTAVASLAGGPVGGAIAGQILRGSAELIKGEKLSTAVGKGIKTAVFGYLSGKAVDALSEIAKNLRIEAIPFGPENLGMEKVSFNIKEKLRFGGLSVDKVYNVPTVYVDKDMASTVKNGLMMLNSDDPLQQAEGFRALENVAKIVNSREYLDKLSATIKDAREIVQKNDSLLQWINGVGEGLRALSQGAVAAATGTKSAPAAPGSTPTTESQVRKLFVEIDRQTLILDEGIFDKIKQAGQRLTSKVTADQLMKAWQAAGSPIDSDQIANFLQTQGVSPEVISKVYQDSGLEAPTLDAKIDMPALIKQIQSLAPTDQQKILASLA